MAINSDHIDAPSGYLNAERHGARSVGFLSAIGLHIVIVAALLVSWTEIYSPTAEATLSVFDVAPPAAEDEPADEPESAPVYEPDPPPQISLPPPVVPPIAKAPRIQIIEEIERVLPQEISIVEAPVEPIEKPQSKPAPPSVANTGAAAQSWESSVLSALNRVKRYPRTAERRGRQGVPWIRFVIDRSGRVLSVNLERSSGFDSLDKEALRLPRRAEPLPTPPDEVPSQSIELVVPVEFFMS